MFLLLYNQKKIKVETKEKYSNLVFSKNMAQLIAGY
jgi:hypothetical protein